MIALLLAMTWASAQENEVSTDAPWWFSCAEYTALEGLPSNDIRDRAIRDNAQLYGVVETAEMDLFPVIDAGDIDDSRVAFEVGMRSLWTAERVPSFQVNNCSQPAHGSVDVFTSSFGIGFRAGPIGAFYATSISGTMQTTNPLARATLTYFGSGFGMLYAPIAPFVGSGGNDRFRMDWLAGLQAKPGPLTARIGYLGSKGLYTNIDEEFSSVYLRWALQPVAQGTKLPYIISGLDRAPLPKDIREVAGSTRIFGRRLKWYVPVPRPEAPPPDEQNRNDTDINFTSGHIEQYDIVGLFDVKASWAFEPESVLHEALFSVHTPYYQSIDIADAGDFGALTGRIQVGVTHMPAAWYYGVGESTRPTFALDAGWGNPMAGSFALVRLRYNHADVLDVFPYAINAMSIQFEFGILAI